LYSGVNSIVCSSSEPSSPIKKILPSLNIICFSEILATSELSLLFIGAGVIGGGEGATGDEGVGESGVGRLSSIVGAGVEVGAEGAGSTGAEVGTCVSDVIFFIFT